VVFDFDGVLVDSNALKRNAYFEVFQNVPGAGAFIETALGEDVDGDRYDIIGLILQRLVAAGEIAEVAENARAVERLAEHYNRICEGAVAMAPEMHGCSDVLQRLAERYPLYVNSATPEEPLRRIIHRRGWMHLFRNVLGRPRTKVENLRLILEREGIPSNALTFIGDSPHDLEAAENCGCRFIAFNGGFRTLDRDRDTISDLRELVRADGGYVQRP